MKVSHKDSSMNKDPVTGYLVFNGISVSLLHKLTIVKPPVYTELLQNSFKVLSDLNNDESKRNIVKFGTELDTAMLDEISNFRKLIQKGNIMDISRNQWLRVPILLTEGAFKAMYDDVSKLQDQKDPEIVELNIMFDKIKKQFS